MRFTSRQNLIWIRVAQKRNAGRPGAGAPPQWLPGGIGSMTLGTSAQQNGLSTADDHGRVVKYILSLPVFT